MWYWLPARTAAHRGMSDNAIAEKAIVIAIAHCSLLKLEPFCNGSPHNKGELERVLPSLLLRLEA